MQQRDRHQDKHTVSACTENAKFHFAITGQAEGNQSEIIQLLHFAMAELNLMCEFIKLQWDVSVSKSLEDGC